MTSQLGAEPSAAGRGDRSFGSAVKWAYVMDGGRQVLMTVTTFVLARLLGPESFGLLALAMGFVLFVQMLQNQGLAAAVIQRPDLSRDHLDAAFWALLGLSVVLTTLCLALAGWWAGFNDLPDLEGVVVALSLLIPIRALVVIQESVMRRQLDFRSLALRTNVAALASAVVAVVLAFAGAGVWALVAQQVVNAGVGLVLLWRLGSWRPRLHFSTPALRSLAGFSSLNFLATVGVFLTDRADAILVGIFMGPIPAGIYYFVTRLISMVVDFASRSLQGAALPELSRYQHDPKIVGDRLSSILSLSSMAAMPILGLVAGLSPDIIALLGRSDWEPAAPALSILAAAGAVRALAMFTGPTMQAIGRPGIHALLSWFAGLVSLIALTVVGVAVRDSSVVDQVVWVSVSRVVAQIVILLAFATPLLVILRVSPWSLLRAVFPGLAAGIVGFAVTTGLVSWLTVPLLVRLALAGTIGVASVIAVLLLASPELKAFALGRWARLGAVMQFGTSGSGRMGTRTSATDDRGEGPESTA